MTTVYMVFIETRTYRNGQRPIEINDQNQIIIGFRLSFYQKTNFNHSFK